MSYSTTDISNSVVLLTSKSTKRNSAVIGNCFSRGSGIKTSVIGEYDPNIPRNIAAYGVLRGTGEAMKNAYEQGCDYWYIDHGYFRRSKYAHFTGLDGYFRIVNSNKSRDIFRIIHDIDGDFPDDRLKNLNLPFKDWRKTGSKILLIPPSKVMANFLGFSKEIWIQDTIKTLRIYTDRDISVCSKGDCTLKRHLEEAWVLVTDHSNSQIEALINGVPVITTSPMRRLGELKDVEYPPLNRSFLKNLAYKQWSRKQIESGQAWRELNG